MFNNEVQENFFEEEKMKYSPFQFKEEDLDEYPFFKNEEEESYSPLYSQSSLSIKDKSGNSLFINNENFINYFMHIDYNTPIPNTDKNIEKNYSSLNSNSKTPPKKNDILLKKKREKEYGIITDNLTGITYYEKDDPINFRKAKKRIQNRESALRMKKLRENNRNKLDEEMNRLEEENERLIKENISLKKEKMFLIEQIKFMQKIIKESNLEFKLKNNIDNDNNNNIFNENKNKEPVFCYEGSKQKIKGKLFNVFVVCILSIVYIVGECSYDENGGNFKKDRNKEHGMKLNSIKNNGNKNFGIWNYFSKIILVFIFFFIFPLFKDIISNIIQLYQNRKRKKYI